MANAEDVIVRMAQVHLTHAPRTVGWRLEYFQGCGLALLGDSVNVVDEH